MTREQFQELVKRPGQSDTFSAEQMASLTVQFPYCQPLRYLHLKQLALHDSIQYPQQLKVTAAISPDRTRLFRLIHPEPVTPASEAVMADLYDSAQPAPPEVAPTAVEELPPAMESTPGTLPEYQATPEEQKMSVADIVNQRLKELNLWQEPEELMPATDVQALEATEPHEQQVTEAPLTAAADAITTTPAEAVKPAWELPATPAEETTIAVEAVNPAWELPEVPAEEWTSQPETAAEQHTPDSNMHQRSATRTTELAPVDQPAPEVADPLETLVHESLVDAQLRHPEYFETPEPSTPPIPAGSPEEPPLKDAMPVFSGHIAEVHSFSEWLHLNSHSTASAGQPVASDTIPPATEPVTKEFTPASEPETPATAEKQQTSTIHTNPTAPFQARFLYVKSTPEAGSVQPPLGSTPVPAVAYTPFQPESTSTAYPETSGFATSLPPETPDPTAETIFTGEIIPPRKPIPDPSLVDTDPPKPRIPAGELIDKFIREEPRITPSKSTFYSPANMARKSVVEPDDILTETLASIYAQQGNYQKAISIYQKLSLKFPEKSRYFAALIEELKKKSNY